MTFKLKDDVIRDAVHANLTMSTIMKPKTIYYIITKLAIKAPTTISGEPVYMSFLMR